MSRFAFRIAPRLGVGLCAGLCISLCATLATAGSVDRLGAVGDSLTDEYFEETYDYARNWTVLLVEERGLSFGPLAGDVSEPEGTWGEPRRTGYEDNWARYGATIDSVVTDGQHLGVADGVLNRGVSHVVISVGINDLNDAYLQIYLGLWDQATIDAWIADRITGLASIVDTIVPTGADIVLMSVLDPGVTPAVQDILGNAAARETVAAAVAQFGDSIRDVAESRGIVFLDQFLLGRAIFGTHLAPRPTLLVGDVAIDLTASDTNTGAIPTAAFVDDDFHPNTVPQAILATVVATALNLGYGAGIPPFSEEEMLDAAGVLYGGTDTLEGEIGPLSDFVTNFNAIFADGFESGDTSAWTVTVP